MVLVASGFTLEDVLGMTLAQFRAFGDAVERRRKKARTELLLMLRSARYDGKKGTEAFREMLKASRTATWLTPG